jgi:ferric-dicitrate binding protein FerR (iron transport regulator)
MISCGLAERGLIEAARGSASDALRLELEAHLAECGSCRDSRKAFGLLGALKAVPAPGLGSAAEERVVRALVAGGGRGPRAVEGRARRHRAAMVGGVVALAGAVTAVGLGLHFRHLQPARPGTVASAITEGERFEAATSGVLSFSGSTVTYEPGTVMAFFPSTRTVRLDKGEIDVDVTEHGPRHFRVITSRFIVDVPGTRFVVTPVGARTVRGLVRILDPAGRELAKVPAGSSWAAPAMGIPAADAPPGALEIAPVVAPALTPPAAPAPAPTRSGPAATTPGRAPSEDASGVTSLLERARAALVSGDASRARALLDRAAAARPARAARPAIDLLMADSWLVARRPDEALGAYRSVMQRYARTPEGETAAFTVCQLLVERGDSGGARAALGDYLERYSRGRFVREARERLAQLEPSNR